MSEGKSYDSGWEEEYNWVKSHPIDKSSAICIICPASFSIKRGECQLKRHAGIKVINGEVRLDPKNSHVLAMARIEDRFGANLSRVRLINIMFRSNNDAPIIEDTEPSASSHGASQMSADNCYNSGWEEEYNWVQRHPIDGSAAICIICPASFSVKRGECQLKRHAGIQVIGGEISLKQSNIHVLAMAEIEGKFGTNLSRVQLANIMFRSDTTAAIIENVEPSTSIGVTRFRYRTVVFETMLIFHAIFNSQSYKSVGRLMTLQKLLLCDKTILKTEIFNKPIQCGEMKARAIVRDVLGDFCLKIIMDAFLSRSKFFSLQTDCSNVKNVKYLPIIICFAEFPEEGGGSIKYQLVDFVDINNERARTIADILINFLEKFDIDPSFLAGFSADNAAINFGKHNGVRAIMAKQFNQEIFKANCLAHFCHNMTRKFIANLDENIERLVLATYNYIARSSKRREILKRIFADMNFIVYEPRKHVATRWTTLGPAIERLLKTWSQLKEVFVEDGLHSTSNDSINSRLIQKMMFEEEVTTLTQLRFARDILLIFGNAIFELEKRETSVIDTYRIMTRLEDSLDEYIFNMDDNDEPMIKKPQERSLKAAFDYLDQKYRKTSCENERQLINPLTLLNPEGKYRFPKFDELEAIVNGITPLQVHIDQHKVRSEYYETCVLFDPDSNGGVETFTELNTLQKWAVFFDKFPHCTELKKLLCYFLSIPASSSEAERIFSKMNIKKRKERSNLSTEMLQKELIITSNFGEMETKDLYSLIHNDAELLSAIGSGRKYKHIRKSRLNMHSLPLMPENFSNHNQNGYGENADDTREQETAAGEIDEENTDQPLYYEDYRTLFPEYEFNDPY